MMKLKQIAVNWYKTNKIPINHTTHKTPFGKHSPKKPLATPEEARKQNKKFGVALAPFGKRRAQRERKRHQKLRLSNLIFLSKITDFMDIKISKKIRNKFETTRYETS